MIVSSPRAKHTCSPDSINVKAGLSTAFFRSHTFIWPRRFPVNTSLCFRKHTQRKEQLSAPSVDTIIQHIRTRIQKWIHNARNNYHNNTTYQSKNARMNTRPRRVNSPILRTGFFCVAVRSNKQPSSPTEAISSSKQASPVQGLQPPNLKHMHSHNVHTASDML